MKEKVAVATVDGKAYFLIINQFREQNISFVSLMPGQPAPSEVKVIITTRSEKPLIKHDNILIFNEGEDLDYLVNEVKRIFQGKAAYEKLIIGVDPGASIGLAVIADGKVIEEGNCFSKNELIKSIIKTARNVNFSLTNVIVKIGNGVPVYKELLESLDDALPPGVTLEVVSEAGTNRPLYRRSRGIRHISSAIRIAARTGYNIPRRQTIATNSGSQ